MTIFGVITKFVVRNADRSCWQYAFVYEFNNNSNNNNNNTYIPALHAPYHPYVGISIIHTENYSKMAILTKDDYL